MKKMRWNLMVCGVSVFILARPVFAKDKSKEAVQKEEKRKIESTEQKVSEPTLNSEAIPVDTNFKTEYGDGSDTFES